MLGKPVIKGTRVTVEDILRKLADGFSEADILEAYPNIALNDIRAAIRYSADVISQETVIAV